jgi:hypothetical protein
MASFFLIRLEFIEPFEKPYKKDANMTYTKPLDVSEVLATFFSYGQSIKWQNLPTLFHPVKTNTPS